MKRKPPHRKRSTPKWMTEAAYGIVSMLPGDAKQARRVLMIVLNLIEAAGRVRVQSAT